MSSEIRVNKINNRAGLGTVTYTDTGIVVSGVSTASNFKTGTSNLHSTGLNIQDLDVDGHTELDNVNIAGIVTVSSDGINAGILNLKTGNNLRLRFSSGGTAQFRGDVDPIANFDRGSANSTNVKWGYLGSDRGIISSISNEFRLTASGTTPMTFHNGGSESLRIDASGNVLVGTTDSTVYANGDSADEGIVLRNGEVIDIARKGDLQLTLNRQTNDGPHIAFYRSGGVKSYISTRSNAFCVDVGGTTERLRIDSSGRVLIGTTVEGYDTGDNLTIASNGHTGITIRSGTSAGGNIFFSDGTSGADEYRGNVSYDHTNNFMRFYVNAAERLRIDSSGKVSISSDGTIDGLLTIKGASDQVGTPSIRLLDGSDTREVSISNTSGDFVASVHGNDNAIHGHIKMFESGILDINNGGATGSNVNRLRIDTSGHMGLGVLPNTNWPTNNDFKALQIGTGACVFGRGSGDEDRGGIAVNWYTDGSNNKYIGNGNAARIYLADGNIYFSTAGANSSGANAAMTLSDRMIISSSGKVGIKFNFNYTMNPQSTDLVIGDGGGGRGITLWTAAAADNQTISFQTNETLSRAEGEISYGPTATSTVADRNAMMFRTNSAERFRIDKNGSLTNTTNSSHSQGAGTFEIKGVINQYSQGSGSGLIFDCDFGRLTGYGDDTNVGNGTNLSACLSHSTTDWSSSNSNTPISVNNGTFQYRVGFGGYMEGISNGGRVSVAAGSGSPNMASKLNTASMTIESWVWYSNGGREVICSRWGSGFPYQFNMICDPNGQFHFNNSGVGCGSGNISGEHFPDKTWHHHVWQYDAGAGTLNRWYINGAFANSYDAGSSLAVSSNTGFGIFSRADDYERWRGKIAIVRIYNRALSASEIKNHFELERGRFGV